MKFDRIFYQENKIKLRKNYVRIAILMVIEVEGHVDNRVNDFSLNLVNFAKYPEACVHLKCELFMGLFNNLLF